MRRLAMYLYGAAVASFGMTALQRPLPYDGVAPGLGLWLLASLFERSRP